MAVELLSFKQLQTFNKNDIADMERTAEADKNPRFTANHEILSFDNLASGRNSIGERGSGNLDNTDIVTVEEIAPPTTKMSSWKAAANFICDIEGVGLLSLPYAILKGGIASLIALFVVPMICHYTGVAMIECLYEEDNEKRKIRVRSTVEDLGEAFFPKYGKKLVIILQSIGLLMVSTSYLVLSGSFLTHAFPKVPLSERIWIIVGAVGVLPTIFLKHLSRIAWVSLLGVVVLMVPIGFVLWYGFSHAPSWKFENLLFWDSQGFFVAFGIIVFSYTAHPALPRLEGCIIHKKSFSKVLGFSFLFVTLVKVVFALTSFLTFVGLTQEVILNNFPVNILYHVVCVFLSLNVLCSYAFPVSVVDQIIQESIASDSCLHRLPRMLLFLLTRLFLLFVTLVTALIVPHFALLLAFFGSMIASLFSFVFPCLFRLKLKGASSSWCRSFCDVFIILLGILSAVLGIFFSGKALVEIYQ